MKNYDLKRIVTMRSNIKVSIIMPYNIDRGFLKDALKSIENQTYNNIEVIESYGDNSLSINFNNGLKKSSGDIIRFLAEDDELTPNSVEDTVLFFILNKDIDFVHSNAINFNTYYKKIENEHIPDFKIPTLEQMIEQNKIHGGTVSYRRRCFEKRSFDETLWTAEEYDFNMWLLYNNYKLGYLDSFTYRYRKHCEQKSVPGFKHMKEKELFMKQEKHKINMRRSYINEIRNRYK